MLIVGLTRRSTRTLTTDKGVSPTAFLQAIHNSVSKAGSFSQIHQQLNERQPNQSFNADAASTSYHLHYAFVLLVSRQCASIGSAG
jgi:hypothetical protein